MFCRARVSLILPFVRAYLPVREELLARTRMPIRKMGIVGRSWSIKLSVLGQEEGSELIEFAFASFVLLMCFFGIMGISLAMYTYQFTAYAAREATRYAMVRGSTWKGTTCTTTTTVNCDADTSAITALVQSIVPPAISPSLLTVTPTWSGAALPGAAETCTTANGPNGPGCLMSVEVDYNFSYLMPFLPTYSMVLTSKSAAIIIQ